MNINSKIKKKFQSFAFHKMMAVILIKSKLYTHYKFNLKMAPLLTTFN
jgi:hypothetical protein